MDTAEKKYDMWQDIVLLWNYACIICVSCVHYITHMSISMARQRISPSLVQGGVRWWLTTIPQPAQFLTHLAGSGETARNHKDASSLHAQASGDLFFSAWVSKIAQRWAGWILKQLGGSSARSTSTLCPPPKLSEHRHPQPSDLSPTYQLWNSNP